MLWTLLWHILSSDTYWVTFSAMAPLFWLLVSFWFPSCRYHPRDFLSCSLSIICPVFRITSLPPVRSFVPSGSGKYCHDPQTIPSLFTIGFLHTLFLSIIHGQSHAPHQPLHTPPSDLHHHQHHKSMPHTLHHYLVLSTSKDCVSHPCVVVCTMIWYSLGHVSAKHCVSYLCADIVHWITFIVSSLENLHILVSSIFLKPQLYIIHVVDILISFSINLCSCYSQSHLRLCICDSSYQTPSTVLLFDSNCWVK